MLIKTLCITLLIFFSTRICAKNLWTVKNIQFEGLQYTSEKQLLKSVSLNVGDKISSDNIRNSIHALFETGRFKDIQVFYSDKTIIFRVKEQPIISGVVFLGNHIVNNTVIEKYLRQLGILKNHAFSPFFINIFLKNIENYYNNISKCQATVKIEKFLSVDKNTIYLKIFIHEGSDTKIKNFKVSGNKIFSQDKILSVLQLKKNQSWLQWLTKNTLYSPKNLHDNLQHLRDFYWNQGFPYFHINKKEVTFVKNTNFVNIEVNISEGNQYTVSRFYINGNVLNSLESIKNIINIHNNELYNKNKIFLIVHKIKRFLSEHGYINSQITVIPKINYQKHTIIIYFNLDLNERVFIRKVLFKGNKITEGSILKREINQLEGKYFNIKEIERGKEKLEKTNYFRGIQISKNLVSNNKNQIDIIYNVQEKPTGSINFGLGYGMNNGFSFNTSFSQKNLFGSGNALKLNAVKNNNQKYLNISMNYPYFFFNNIDFNTNVFYNDWKYNSSTVVEPIKNTYGFENNLGFLLNDAHKINLGFGYTHNSIIHDEQKNNANIKDTQKSDVKFSNNQSFNDFTLNYSWLFNTLKSFYFPVSGRQTYFNIKHTIPGSDNSFYKIVLDAEKYSPLNKKENFIFLSHVHLGLGQGLFGKQLPSYENFNAGASNNIRGFRSKTIGPKKIYKNANFNECIKSQNNRFCESLDSIGGNSTAVANFELITPIPFISQEYSKFLRSSLFFDIGNVWNAPLNNNIKDNSTSLLNDIYASFGVSLQWYSPIGPLVFSYAYPLQKNIHNQLEPFQFNFGKSW